MGFCGAQVVKNPPCNAGDTASIPPWSGKIPYASQQLSPRAATTKACALEPVLHKKRSRRSENPEHRS